MFSEFCRITVSKNCGPFRGSQDMVEVLIKEIDVLKDVGRFYPLISI